MPGNNDSNMFTRLNKRGCFGVLLKDGTLLAVAEIERITLYQEEKYADLEMLNGGKKLPKRALGKDISYPIGKATKVTVRLKDIMAIIDLNNFYREPGIL